MFVSQGLFISLPIICSIDLNFPVLQDLTFFLINYIVSLIANFIIFVIIQLVAICIYLGQFRLKIKEPIE